MKQNTSPLANYLDTITEYNKGLEKFPMAKEILLEANAWNFSSAQDVEQFVESVKDAADIFARMACLALDIQEAYKEM